MYDWEKRAYFTTLGELRTLLAKYPDHTKVCTGGVLGSWLHFDLNEMLVSFDDEDLDSDYSYDYERYLGLSSEQIDELFTHLRQQQIDTHFQRMSQENLDF